MAIPKVMGTEIEYGITVKGDPDFDPISSCVLLVNAYREDHAGEILWDYDQENPLADARGFQVDGEKYTPNQQENIARNKTLINGARYYVDHAHPEYSCPEVTNPRDLVVHEKAGERIVELSRNRDRYMRKHHSKGAARIVRWLTAWTYGVRTVVAVVLPGHDPRRYWHHVRATLRPEHGEGLREAAYEHNRGGRRL